jgi:hypothetical protein
VPSQIGRDSNCTTTQNLIGRRFGRLLVVSFTRSADGRECWNCICDCGNFRRNRKHTLVNGKSLSCGCLSAARTKARLITHGSSYTKIYCAWTDMNRRCYNRASNNFHNYGGRGISVCERWRNSFEAFRDDMGPRPAGMSIERIDNDGNYEPGNCRWATRSEQNRNTRQNRLVTFNNETRCVSGWAEILKISRWAVYYRHKHGIPLDNPFIPKFHRKNH